MVNLVLCVWFVKNGSLFPLSPLKQILRVLGESAIAVRTKAMKCLSEVVAVDPSILARVSLLYPTLNLMHLNMLRAFLSVHKCFLSPHPLLLSSVGHATWGPWSSDGQLHQCSRGCSGAAGTLCAEQTPAHRAVLRHADREDTGNEHTP